MDGTFPVYLKFYFSYMKGTNPDGSQVPRPGVLRVLLQRRRRGAQFARYSYGSYQSLGCVELPWTRPRRPTRYLTYGSLVTVTGPVA